MTRRFQEDEGLILRYVVGTREVEAGSVAEHVARRRDEDGGDSCPCTPPRSIDLGVPC